LICCLPAPLWS